MRLESHRCPLGVKDPRLSFLINRTFDEEPRVFPANVREVAARNKEVQEDIMICFPHSALFEDDLADPVHGSAGGCEPDPEGWTQVSIKKISSVSKGRGA